jgi:hypothetical protein
MVRDSAALPSWRLNLESFAMAQTSPKQNKALVLEAFDTLFNKRDYTAAERFWSDRYIHSYSARP